MTLTSDQKNEILFIHERLHPMDAIPMDIGEIRVLSQENFLKLSENKTVFIHRGDDYARFFFVTDGLIYVYQIGEYYLEDDDDDYLEDDDFDECDNHSKYNVDKYISDQLPDDFSECSRDDLLFNVWDPNSNFSNEIERMIKERKMQHKWLEDSFFDENIRQPFEQALSKELIDVNNRIKDAKEEYNDCGTSDLEKKIIIRDIISRAQRKIQYNFYSLINSPEISEKIIKIGSEFKAQTEQKIRDEVKSLDFHNMTSKQQKSKIIDQLYRKYNPNMYRSRYDITKKDIEYIIDNFKEE